MKNKNIAHTESVAYILVINKKKKKKEFRREKSAKKLMRLYII